jgi:hypothetical protein
MEYRGKFEDGIVRPDDPVNLPNGTPVEFHPVTRQGGTAERLPDELADADRLARSNRTIEDIAREQNVKPIRSLDELGGEWPDDKDDVDEFIRMTKESRR